MGSPLTDGAQPVPEQRLVAHRQLLPVYGWSVTFCDMESLPILGQLSWLCSHWQSVGH